MREFSRWLPMACDITGRADLFGFVQYEPAPARAAHFLWRADKSTSQFLADAQPVFCFVSNLYVT